MTVCRQHIYHYLHRTGTMLDCGRIQHYWSLIGWYHSDYAPVTSQGSAPVTSLMAYPAIFLWACFPWTFQLKNSLNDFWICQWICHGIDQWIALWICQESDLCLPWSWHGNCLISDCWKNSPSRTFHAGGKKKYQTCCFQDVLTCNTKRFCQVFGLNNWTVFRILN